MKSFLETAKRTLSKVSWLSLDVFDTAIHRRVGVPTDIFRLMHEEAAAIVGDGLPDFHPVRVSAEHKARAAITGQESGVTEISIGQIYDELQKTLSLSHDQRQLLIDLELRTEAKFVYGNPLILELYEEAKKMGKSVFFLSDMYLGSHHIGKMLETAGYREPRVFVSSDYGHSKLTGKLYRRVAHELKISGGDILHVGDNFRSDYIRARLNGWRALYFDMGRSSSL